MANVETRSVSQRKDGNKLPERDMMNQDYTFHTMHYYH